MQITLPYNFKPRKYQLPILKALDSGKKRAVWCAHRRSGKDVTILNWCVKRLMQGEAMSCYYVFPTYSQGKKAIWDSVNNDGFRILDYIPEQIIERKNEQEMKIRLKNGSLFQIVGGENVDSLMGTNPKILVFSEYAMHTPVVWDYMSPIVNANDGWAIFISTPRGKNHFYDMTQIAQDNPDRWFYEILPNDKTNVFTEEQIEEERKRHSEEFVQQEYFCSFDRGVEGTYYGRIIDKMRTDGRVSSVQYETKVPVSTAWDIGFGDSTSVCFYQVIGVELRVIDFYEAQGEGVQHYAKVLQSKPYVYGSHYFPHDAGAGSIQTGKTLSQIAHEIGIKNIVLPRYDFSVGIEAARSVLNTCYIEKDKCAYLLKCLENYSKKYNDKMQSYSETPIHNWASHAADSFRYMALAKERYGSAGAGQGLSADQIRDWRKKNLGY
jgi:phage terminase large subunit